MSDGARQAPSDAIASPYWTGPSHSRGGFSHEPTPVRRPPSSGFMHIDLGPARSWGERFPKRRDRLRGRDAAGARGAGREPDAEGRRGGRRRHGRRRRRRGGAAGAGRRRRARCCRWCPTSTPCAGCSSRSRSAASPSRSTPGSTTGSGAGGDRRPSRPARCRAARPHRPAHRAPGRRRPPAPPRLPPLRRAARPAAGAPRSIGENQ